MTPRLLDRSVDDVLERIGDVQPAASVAQSGTRVGPFTVLDKLGEGGSSIVFRAFREQAGVKQTVARNCCVADCFRARSSGDF